MHCSCWPALQVVWALPPVRPNVQWAGRLSSWLDENLTFVVVGTERILLMGSSAIAAAAASRADGAFWKAYKSQLLFCFSFFLFQMALAGGISQTKRMATAQSRTPDRSITGLARRSVAGSTGGVLQSAAPNAVVPDASLDKPELHTA